MGAEAKNASRATAAVPSTRLSGCGELSSLGLEDRRRISEPLPAW